MAKIKFRRDTAATWTEANPVLAQGEPGFEHNTGRLKIGDGVTAWNSLAYSGGGSGGGDLTTIIVPEQGTAYKGLQVSYGVIHSNNENNNELNVNKIVIHKPAITTTEIDPTSENDYFRVAGLSNSNVLAMFVIYGDVNGAKPLSDLKAFAEAAIDNVILNNAIEENYNTVGQMKAAFYDNYPTLASAAGGLDQDFVFFQTYTNAATGITTVREGSGAIFTFEEAAGSYSFLSIANGGSNYLPGHKLVVLGSALGGTDGINDAIFTVNTVDAGAITSVNLGGTSFATAPVGGWTFPASNYQVGSGFVVAGVGKNQDTTLYTNTNSQGSGYVVNDVLTLLGSDLQGGLSPDNDITITVTGVDGGGSLQTWTVTGTFPNIWPDNNIGDGGNDQYDTGNYINSSFTTQIAYNAGNTVSDGTTAFGAGSSYSFVYNTGIFGLFVSGNSSTYIETSGNSGGDGVSTTEAGNIYGPNEPEQTFDNAINYLNIVSDNPMDGIRFSDGTRLISAAGVGRVKLTSPDDRRIEETSGYKSVSVTARTTTNLTATASRSAVNESGIWLGSSELIHDIIVSPQLYGIIDYDSIQFSVDNNTWYNFSTISVIDNERVYGIPVPVSYNQGDPIYFRYNSGGAPVVWWNKNELPAGGSDFRGAVIDYHAWTGSGTWIGTIHIVDDDGEENITHTEVSSGSTDAENDDLWLVQNEGTISYRRTDGDAKTAKIQWTAKVFYGSELYD